MCVCVYSVHRHSINFSLLLFILFFLDLVLFIAFHEYYVIFMSFRVICFQSCFTLVCCCFFLVVVPVPYTNEPLSNAKHPSSNFVYRPPVANYRTIFVHHRWNRFYLPCSLLIGFGSIENTWNPNELIDIHLAGCLFVHRTTNSKYFRGTKLQEFTSKTDFFCVRLTCNVNPSSMRIKCGLIRIRGEGRGREKTGEKQAF